MAEKLRLAAKKTNHNFTKTRNRFILVILLKLNTLMTTPPIVMDIDVTAYQNILKNLIDARIKMQKKGD